MTSESEWSVVHTQAVADALLDSTHGLHDSVATEGCWQGAEFVNRSGELELHGYGTLHLSITSQFKDAGDLELRFRGVKGFVYDYECDLAPAILLESKGVLARFGAWEILAEALEYRQDTK